MYVVLPVSGNSWTLIRSRSAVSEGSRWSSNHPNDIVWQYSMCCFDSDKLGFCFLYYSLGASVVNFSVADCKGYVLFSYIRKCPLLSWSWKKYISWDILVTNFPYLPLLLSSFFLAKGSGDSSLEKEFTSTIVGPTVSTPNSQHSSPSRSLSGEYTISDSNRVFLKCVTLIMVRAETFVYIRQ